MTTASPTAIYDKLARLERELQGLKIQSYCVLPRAARPKAPYAERTIMEALKQTRDAIWQERYAKKIARVR